MPKEKKKRSANFAEYEITLLCDIIKKYSTLIESKETDANIWKQKQATWEKITAQFNLENKTGIIRTLTNLKIKYEGIKKDLRKKVAFNKVETLKTGGGIANIKPLTVYEANIYRSIAPGIEGLAPRFDDDNIFDTDISKNKTLETCNNSDDADDAIQIEFVDKLETQSAGMTSSATAPDLSSSDLLMQEKEKEDANKTSTYTGHRWDPEYLKTPKSKALNIRKKNMLTKLEASEKINRISERKNELLELQILYAKKEAEIQEEQNKKLKNLNKI